MYISACKKEKRIMYINLHDRYKNNARGQVYLGKIGFECMGVLRNGIYGNFFGYASLEFLSLESLSLDSESSSLALADSR